MFNELVAIEETLLNRAAVDKLSLLAREVKMYHDSPRDDQETIRRIGDADGVLVSFRTPIGKAVLDACPNIRYIGMCCTLYDEKCCNVDVAEARRKGITVWGVRDYGDEGVVEYAISELVRFLHGFGDRQWRKDKYELTRQRIGIIGLGRTGRMLADAFRFLGAEVGYYSRSRKPEAEAAGIVYYPLHDLLYYADIVLTCLPRNTYLLGKEEFRILGDGKILMNTSIGATFDVPALCEWLESNQKSFYFCDETGMGTLAEKLTSCPNVIYTPVVAGKSIQSVERLSEKALANIERYMLENKMIFGDRN